MAVITLAGITRTASAATIVVTCQEGGQAPYLLKINTDKNTVTDGSSRSGTYPAQITDEEITWDENPQMFFRFSLNRITGNLHIVGTGTAAGAIGDDQCRKGEAKF